jgi:predicted restriction endonuclease
MARHIPWSRDELLVAFRLYCQTPFGRLHQHNPEIIELAELIGRTPSAVAMKACNFASLDPTQQARNIRALGNVSSADRTLWNEFLIDSQMIAAEAEEAYEHLAQTTAFSVKDETVFPSGPTEVLRTVRTRRVQTFFRSTVLTSYHFRCALTGLSVPVLLNASHIIPWHLDESRRADPSNGICLNSLHDRAFDRGLITFDEQWRLMLSPQLRIANTDVFQREVLVEFAGRSLQLPDRFRPDPDAMAYHREQVFMSGSK